MSKSVLQAAWLPGSTLAVNSTSLPSGETVISSNPPQGWVGVSASRSGVSSTGSATALVTTNRWLRLPSSQVSQWRTISSS